MGGRPRTPKIHLWGPGGPAPPRPPFFEIRKVRLEVQVLFPAISGKADFLCFCLCIFYKRRFVEHLKRLPRAPWGPDGRAAEAKNVARATFCTFPPQGPRGGAMDPWGFPWDPIGGPMGSQRVTHGIPRVGPWDPWAHGLVGAWPMRTHGPFGPKDPRTLAPWALGAHRPLGLFFATIGFCVSS